MEQVPRLPFSVKNKYGSTCSRLTRLKGSTYYYFLTPGPKGKKKKKKNIIKNKTQTDHYTTVIKKKKMKKRVVAQRLLPFSPTLSITIYPHSSSLYQIKNSNHFFRYISLNLKKSLIIIYIIIYYFNILI